MHISNLMRARSKQSEPRSNGVERQNKQRNYLTFASGMASLQSTNKNSMRIKTHFHLVGFLYYADETKYIRSINNHERCERFNARKSQVRPLVI